MRLVQRSARSAANWFYRLAYLLRGLVVSNVLIFCVKLKPKRPDVKSKHSTAFSPTQLQNFETRRLNTTTKQIKMESFEFWNNWKKDINQRATNQSQLTSELDGEKLKDTLKVSADFPRGTFSKKLWVRIVTKVPMAG